MQNFLTWLGRLVFAGRHESGKPDLRVTNSHLRAAQIRRRSELLNKPRSRRRAEDQPREDYDADSELGYVVEDAGPGKNVLRPKYAREDSGTHETLKILDAVASEDSDSDGSGFDPYNTGQFDRSRNWARHIRK